MAPRRRIPSKGEIWHVNGDPAAGNEFQGPHYYLVLSVRELSATFGTPICVPITSGGLFARAHGVTVSLDGSSTDTGKVTGVVLCFALRALDLTARQAQYVAKVDPAIMDEVLSIVVDIIDPAC
ncbi:type II toxin-antitoxin system PemK/MazF family toxin (plasmid) [Edwardsiella tarda]|uniref:type II toxin-antitoxin system PemK/MazF family toxin n=1 Tax=Edwardsiella tarda TaxID=636 RepID=UPI000D51D825|nr:type II toxin-antitoxin system PemK/MazF family toxin [Edwardsiella tarda]UCQ29525.1 type II toxin-antitoxin system PemK/MazF family toxin [Edwardsiella tarda]